MKNLILRFRKWWLERQIREEFDRELSLMIDAVLAEMGRRDE